MLGQITKINNSILTLLSSEPVKLKEGQTVEIIKVNNKDIAFRKLQGLFYLLLSELVQTTGYSEIYWKRVLKKQADYFISITEPDGKITREYRSVSRDESDMDSLSKLFTASCHYIKENDVIDLNSFENRYFEITGKTLLF